ncbi:MAG: 2-hydroxyacid dehydrogenase [Clostridiales bacterium]|nr:2-hydroxyacid dehydrogenase [Clostridiales bacterium]
MKILIIASQSRYEKFMPEDGIARRCELVYRPVGTLNGALLEAAGDAEVILADAIATVDADLIAQMPNLRLIHSEGAAYDRIDGAAARERGVYVCNNQGANAQAVAEQAILLMLGLLRFVEGGHRAVLDGRQINIKEEKMVSGITELRDCTVGLVGFGNIARQTALLLHAFGANCLYYSPHRKDGETEARYCVEYRSLDDLLAQSDIVSLHSAVTPETVGMMNRETLGRMKPGAFLVNTARGDLVDQEALVQALASGHLEGAGLDTLTPEPVTRDNPLVRFAAEHPCRILFSPHIGGVTTGCFRRMHSRMWDNVAAVERGERPTCVVNGVSNPKTAV